MAPFELFIDRTPEGINVYNRGEIIDGDFALAAHISPNGVLRWYMREDCVPPDYKRRVQELAARESARR